MRKHTYVTAESFILSREFFGMKLGLENITSFLSELNNPQKTYLTIHIAGTNGKGSTAAMLASILRANGYKTGLFTSPHLVDFRERMTVNGKKISKTAVVNFVNKQRTNLSKRKLSFFELTASLAFDFFHRAKVDIAIIETGLGGRLDATNVLEPILTITTEISRDHLEILGNTEKKIAREKAGIIKPNTMHLVGMLKQEAMKVISTRAKILGAPLYKLYKSDFSQGRNIFSFGYHSRNINLRNITPSLIGRHQQRNAALAIKASELISKYGLLLDKSLVKKGIEETKWAGRFQILAKQNSPTFVLDVAHNVTGVEAYVESFKSKFPGRKTKIITGVVKRKEHQEMFDLLSEIAEIYYLVPLKSKRTADLRELTENINWKNIPVKRVSALEIARKSVLSLAKFDDIISVIGSHYLVGEYFKKYKIK